MDSLALYPEIAKEATIDTNGQGWFSLRATARLCGISPSLLNDARPTIQNDPKSQKKGLLYWLKENPPETLPVTLKPFSGFNFLANKTDRSSPIFLPDVLVAGVVDYYANDYGVPKEQAKKSLQAFSAIGIRKWLYYLKGQKDDLNNIVPHTSSPVSANFNQLVNEISGLTKKLTEVTEAWENYPALKTISQNQYLINRGKLLPPQENSTFTLKELLSENGLELTRGEMIQLGIRIAQTYRTLKGNIQPTKKGNNFVYDLSDYALIATVLRDMGYEI
ncbi:MAG: hypothetical protein QNJ54_36380 [Prochloraceae cyanobacterium]|nr:hypothetical protein [Prochloraceae cyanobacterium]